MTSLSTSIGHAAPGRRAASLAQMASWHLHRFWSSLERIGQRRAAPELARAARRLAVTHPELAATLAADARRWQAR